MNVLITGASGMIGSLVLRHCLADESIKSVIALNRKALNISNDKYKEVIVENFLDLSDYSALLTEVDVVYYCLGAYTGKLDRQAFHKVNVEYPKELSKQINKSTEKSIRFCLLSGAGADRSENSKVAFAKDKGEIENYLAAYHKNFYTFRPSYIYPVTPRQEPNFMYKVSRWLYPLIKHLGKNASIKSTELAKAMFYVGLNGCEHQVIENADIKKLYAQIQ